MADVFLSYVREDRSRAADVAAALTRQGWTVWWDRQILPGNTFEREIAQQLADARCVVVLWSRTSVTSDWVRDEASEATNRRKLVPVLIDDVTPPFGFRQYHNANLASWTGDDTDPEFALLVGGINVFAPRGAQTQEPISETLPGTESAPASTPDPHDEDVESPAGPEIIASTAHSGIENEPTTNSPMGPSDPAELEVDTGGPTANSTTRRRQTSPDPEQASVEAVPLTSSIVDYKPTGGTPTALRETDEHTVLTAHPAPGTRSRVRVTRVQMALALTALVLVVGMAIWKVLSDAPRPQEPTVPETIVVKDEPTVLRDAIANVPRGPKNRRHIVLLKADQDAGHAAYTVVQARLELVPKNVMADDHLWLSAVLVTPNFFAMFREQSLLVGTTFSANVADEKKPLETVLSYNLWATHFGRDPALVGESVKLNDVDYQVVGVARDGFDYPPLAKLWTTVIHADTVSMPAVISHSGR